MEAGSERMLVRPSLLRLIVVSLLYTAVVAVIALAIDRFVFGGVVAGFRIEFVAVVFCVWVLLQAVFSWYVCSFEVDSRGLHQNHIVAHIEQVLRHLSGGKSISWQDRVWLMTQTRYIAAACFRIPEGGLLSQIRNFPKLTCIVLPWKWLVADIEALQSMLKEYAPLGHPLRNFYGVAEDCVFRDEQSS